MGMLGVLNYGLCRNILGLWAYEAGAVWSHGGSFGRDTGSCGFRFSVLGVGACRLMER